MFTVAALIGFSTSASASPLPYAPSPVLPLDDPRLRTKAPGIPEQVHLIGGPPNKVGIVWARSASSGLVQDGVDYCQLADYSATSCVPDSISFVPAAGAWTYSSMNHDEYCDWSSAYENASCFYNSPSLNSVRLERLQAGVGYLYRIKGEAGWRRFRTPPSVGLPIDFGVVADLGQTNNSAATMERMRQSWEKSPTGMDSIIFPGDLSYADGYGPRWDSFGRLADALFSQVPTCYGGGNHEVGTGFENWQPFLNRYPSMFLREDSGSTSDLYYSYDAGLAHVVMLCSYCPAAPGTEQYRWLERDLASMRRTRTPWLVLSWHTPWYTSNAHHSMKEGAAMRQAMEKLIYHAQADIVFTGHVHAYERTLPVYQNKTDPCGPVHITIGDGGNREGPAVPWATPATPAPPLYGQPEWSAVREFAFGYGRLRLRNATFAEWEWYRDDRGASVISDKTTLRRGPARPKCDRTTQQDLVV